MGQAQGSHDDSTALAAFNQMNLSITLWSSSAFLFCLSAIAQIPGVNEMVKAADIAREKDVVWLALATAIVSIVYSAWLNYRKDKLSEAATAALVETAKQSAAVALSVDALRHELQDRPCFHKGDRER